MRMIRRRPRSRRRPRLFFEDEHEDDDEDDFYRSPKISSEVLLDLSPKEAYRLA